MTKQLTWQADKGWDAPFPLPLPGPALILWVPKGPNHLAFNRELIGCGSPNEEIHVVQGCFNYTSHFCDSNFQITTSLHQWFSLITRGRAQIQPHCLGEQEIVCQMDPCLVSPLGRGIRLSELFLITQWRLLNLLQSTDFPEALGGELLNRPLQEGRAAIMPVPTHTKSPSTLSLRTPERESLGIWHPKYLCQQTFPTGRPDS